MNLILTLLVITVSLWFAAMHSAAQEQPSAPESPVYLLQNDRLNRLDTTTGASQVVAELTRLANLETVQSDRVDRRLWAADIDPQARYLYQIEAWGRSSNRRILGAPTGAELIQVNLATNERRVIADSTTVFNFVLSPDGQRIVIFYNTGEYLFSHQHACVWDLETSRCQQLKFDNIAIALWLDENRFITRTSDIHPLQLVDADTFSTQTLFFPPEWQIYWGMLHPRENLLVVSGQPYENALEHPNSFLTYDLETGSVEILPFNALDEYWTVPEISFSPDGVYLLYGDRSRSTLVNFDSGTLIHEFTSVYSAGWIDDETLIVQGSRDEGSLEIMRVNAASGQITTLRSGEAAAGVLLIP